MIPFALVFVVAFGVFSVWVFHLIAGLREAVAKFDRLEQEVDALREGLDNLLIGNVAREDIRALIRRAFDSRR